jgi:catechol 2,3-dioxygenase-like lactoylglutathione lyase family enzyme
MPTTPVSRIKAMSPQLQVAHLEQSLAFYTTRLGFAIDFRYEDFYAGIRKDGFTIHLKTGAPNTQEQENKRANEDLDIVFWVDGINELYEEMSGKPVEITQALREMPYGKEFYIADPDWHIIAFLKTP